MSKNNQNKTKIPLRQKTILIILGFLLTAIILEVGLRFSGFILLSLQENKNRASLKQKSTYRIMCLGESTTQGQWPPFLEDILNQSNIGVKFSVIDKGIAGTTTSVILANLESNLNAYRPDVVITMMGVNDRPYEPVSDSKIIKILKSFRVYKLTRLLWLHIVTRLQEIRSYRPSRHVARIKPALKKTALKQPDAQKNNSNLSGEPLRLKKAIERNLGDAQAHMELAGLYRDQGKFSEAEELLKKYIERNPGNAQAHMDLAWLYRDQGKFSEAEELLKKYIELNPGDAQAHIELAWLYRAQGKFSEAEELLKKCIERNPGDAQAHIELAGLYRNQGKLSEAEELLRKCIELNPGNAQAHIALAGLYRYQGKLSEAEELLKKYIELNPGNKLADAVYTQLETLYEEMDKPALAMEYGRKVNVLQLNYYQPITITNYHKLKAILDKKGIVYVCVQYPMRPLNPLKMVFEGEQNIIFVDNERIFKDAVKQGSYKDYFRDMFVGDFGHCTNEGNRLLAENIANVTLKEVFGK